MATSRQLFLDDPYLRSIAASVIAVRHDAVMLDRTVFYPTGGGQPGDRGALFDLRGERWEVVDTVRSDAGEGLWHVGLTPPPFRPGDAVQATIDWERRHAHMRMHSCLHLLCSLVPAPVTGCGISVDRGRLDFDLPENTLDKQALTDRLNALIAENLPITTDSLSYDVLIHLPGLVRTAGTMPPQGDGQVRLICIDGVDRQPCGGTHVRSTGEIGRVAVTKIEKKSRECRRVVIGFVDTAA